ncbi:MAG: PfkB family carbohydrate kinase [Bacteroidota bacterium]
MNNPPAYDVIAAGELLVDMIGDQSGVSLEDTKNFSRYKGGSTANLANNLNLLGKKTALVASVGNDGLGKFLVQSVKQTGLDSSHIRVINGCRTSLILVSKSTGTPDFLAYRCADFQFIPSQLPDDLLSNAKIFHTTCFALSQSPAQEVILTSAKRAHGFGARLSIDLNYAPEIWPDRESAINIVKEYCALGALVKISKDDHTRLFGIGPAEDSITSLLDFGASKVCLTLGKEGCKTASATNPKIRYFPVPKTEISGDSTGAGDAFWSGFLAGYLDGQSTEECVKAGINVSAIKLKQTGQLSEAINISKIYK